MRGKKRKRTVFSREGGKHKLSDCITITNDKYELRIYRDEYAENPREWENMGKMVCWHRRYNLGDKHDYGSPQDFYESEEYKNVFAILPLYLYDHSGITISNTDFNDRWDSGQVGYIYASKESVKAMLGREPTEEDKPQILERLKGETKIYDQYLQGDCYAFTIESNKGEYVDSVGGFYGDTVREVADEMKDCMGAEFHELFNQVIHPQGESVAS